MFAPSFNLLPVAPVEFALSLQDKAKKLAQGTYTLPYFHFGPLQNIAN